PPHLHSFPTRRSSDLFDGCRLSSDQSLRAVELGTETRTLVRDRRRLLQSLKLGHPLGRRARPRASNILESGTHRSRHALGFSLQDRKSTRLNSSHRTI